MKLVGVSLRYGSKLAVVITLILVAVMLASYALLSPPANYYKPSGGSEQAGWSLGGSDAVELYSSSSSVKAMPVDLLGERYLQELSACSGLKLGERDVMILEYRFLPFDVLILEDGGRDFIAQAESAVLTVEVSKAGAGYQVLFRLTYIGDGLRPTDGTPPSEWERIELSIARELLTVYEPGRGYSLPNGMPLGYLFPLFERGEVLTVDYLWAKPGERFALESRRAVTARRGLLTIWHLKDRVALAINSSQLIGPIPLDEAYNRSYIEGVIRRSEKPRAFGGCPDLLAFAHYTSTLEGALLSVSIDYPTSLPVFMLMEGAARFIPSGSYEWNGEQPEELPASALAELLGVRSAQVALELVELRIERREG